MFKTFLQSKLRVAAPTDVAAYNIEGYTFLICQPRVVLQNYKVQLLHVTQQSFSEVKYVIIDEMSKNCVVRLTSSYIRYFLNTHNTCLENAYAYYLDMLGNYLQ